MNKQEQQREAKKSQLFAEILLFLVNSKREHTECEDPFYSCPQAPNYTNWDEKEPKVLDCNCGAEKYNSDLKELLTKIEKFNQ